VVEIWRFEIADKSADGAAAACYMHARRGRGLTARYLVHRHMFDELPTNTRLDTIANVTVSNTDTSKPRQHMFVVGLYLCTCSSMRVRVRNPTFRFPPLHSPM
jgi:hypothetical protein